MRNGSRNRALTAASAAISLFLVLSGCGNQTEKPKRQAAEDQPKTQTAEEHPNVALLRSAYESFGRGDVPGALALFDDAIVFHIPGSNQLSGDHTGKAAVGANLRKFRELSGGTFKLQPIHIVADDTYGAVIAQASGSRNGRSVSDQPVHVWRFEGGEPVEMWIYPRDFRAFDAFWS